MFPGSINKRFGGPGLSMTYFHFSPDGKIVARPSPATALTQSQSHRLSVHETLHSSSNSAGAMLQLSPASGEVGSGPLKTLTVVAIFMTDQVPGASAIARISVWPVAMYVIEMKYRPNSVSELSVTGFSR